jgi:hypothetical protein
MVGLVPMQTSLVTRKHEWGEQHILVPFREPVHPRNAVQWFFITSSMNLTCLRRHTLPDSGHAACADLVLPAAVRPCLEAPLHKRLDRRELVSLALVADASAERAEKVSLALCRCYN